MSTLLGPGVPAPSATSLDGPNSGGGPSQPMLWVVVPLLAVFAAGFLFVLAWRRHRNARSAGASAWPRDPHAVARMGGRPWATWNRSRDVEGLNELGEAPPPYDTKKPPPIEYHCECEPAPPEMTFMAGGRVEAPDYVAPPPAAQLAPPSPSNVA